MKRHPRTPIAIFLCVFLLGILLAPRISVSWDEPDNIFAGGVYWNFFRHGFDQTYFTRTDSEASIFGGVIFTQNQSMERYPPVPNYLGTAAALIRSFLGHTLVNTDIIESFHIASGIFFGILVAYAYQWGMLLGLSHSASILSACLVYFFPTMFGYGYSNIKDIAQVALFTASLYHLAVSFVKSHRFHLILGGILWGLAFASKFNAVYVPIIWGLWLWMGKQADTSIFGRKITSRVLLKVLWIVAFGCVGGVVVYAVWPYLWFDPYSRIVAVLRYFTTVGQGYRVYWNGRIYSVGLGESLWWYPLANVWLVTPPPILFAMLVGLVLLLLASLPRYSGVLPVCVKTQKFHVLLLLWVFVPLVRTVFPWSAFYDGSRHFLEIFPALILISVLGMGFVWNSFASQFMEALTARRAVALLLGCVAVFSLVHINVQYFPYATGYYNVFARNPNELYDRDIEGLAIKEGIDYLHSRYGNITLWAPISGHQSWYYLRGGDQYVYTTQQANSIILINKSSHISRKDFEKSLAGTGFEHDHTIRRGDAEFGWVYRKK